MWITPTVYCPTSQNAYSFERNRGTLLVCESSAKLPVDLSVESVGDMYIESSAFNSHHVTSGHLAASLQCVFKDMSFPYTSTRI